jgi:DNA-binding transcriptional LysR family regulator
VGIEVNSLELIETYVLAGLGIGLSVAVPGRRFPAGIRVLPLPDFPKVVIGALWRGRLTVITEALLAELRSRAKSLAEADAPPPNPA